MSLPSATSRLPATRTGAGAEALLASAINEIGLAVLREGVQHPEITGLLEAVGRLSPHRVCTYLFELASDFTTFYEHCPVLRAPSADVTASRLALSDLTARVLAHGLGLLGIDAPEQM